MLVTDNLPSAKLAYLASKMQISQSPSLQNSAKIMKNSKIDFENLHDLVKNLSHFAILHQKSHTSENNITANLNRSADYACQSLCKQLLDNSFKEPQITTQNENP